MVFVPADIGSLGIIIDQHAAYPEYANVKLLDTGVRWFLHTCEIELVRRNSHGWMTWV